MSESLRDRLDRQREAGAAKRTSEVNATIGRAIDALRASAIAERSLQVGERAPTFELPNVRGETVRLGDLLGRCPVVLAFYRGAW